MHVVYGCVLMYRSEARFGKAAMYRVLDVMMRYHTTYLRDVHVLQLLPGCTAHALAARHGAQEVWQSEQ
jgi:hypothetical protein